MKSKAQVANIHLFLIAKKYQSAEYTQKMTLQTNEPVVINHLPVSSRNHVPKLESKIL